MVFLQYFNNFKISFEAGFVCKDQNFLLLLRKQLRDEKKDLPALPFAKNCPKTSSEVASKIQSHASPFDEVMEVTNNALADPELNMSVDSKQKQLQRILQTATELGTKSTLPARGDLVAILNISNIPDPSLQFLHSIFIEPDEQRVLTRDEMITDLSNFVPYVRVEHCNDTISSKVCASCSRKFNFFNKPNQTCYRCQVQFCKSCSMKEIGIVPRLQLKPRETFCSNCSQQLTQLDVDDWTRFSVDLIKVGTTGSIRAAMGCLTVALCLSESDTKPIVRVAQGFFHHGLPQLAIPFVTTVLQNSKDSREILGMYVLSAQIFKTMADQAMSDQQLQWNFLLAAKDCCNLALQEVSSMDTSIEVPNLTSVKDDITASLHLIREQQEHKHELEVQLLCVQMEALWQRRDCESLLTMILSSDEDATTLSFLPRLESMNVLALEHFLAPKESFLDRMCADDKCALVFFRGILKIQKKRLSEGLADIEEAAYQSHHHEWLKEAVANFIIGLMIDDPASLFPPDSFREFLAGKRVLSGDNFGDRFESLFPQKHELIPPFSRNWPELSVTGLNTKGHIKFEKAVLSQVDKGAWNEWDVAMAYIDYVPGCGHPAEFALCFLNAAMWLLKSLNKTLSSSSKVPRSKVYATKSLIVKCLHSSRSMAYLHLHPGMQLYVSRLCLGTLMETMHLAKNYATQEDVDLTTSLLHLILYTCRFCPIWCFPSVPLSEAVLMNIKTGRFHQDFLIDLQEIDQKKWPMTRPELLYQLYENDLRYVCPVEDSAGLHARAMEEMLSDKGWTYQDVADLMTSPLSPRDHEGFLIQQPFLGAPLEFSELKGFAFNLDSDNPSIEIIAIPADRSRGRIGLFSMEDVQTVLQVETIDLVIFSLDPPNENQRFHPFQQFRYGNDKLHKTPWLHTLFETDYLLKSFSVGAEVSAKPPFNQRPCGKGLTKGLPKHLQEAVKTVSSRGNTISNIHRFWIQAGELVYEQKQDGSKLTFNLGNLKMSVRSHPLFPGSDGKLEDTEDQTDPESPEAKFAANLTAHYDELGLHFPMFARLRELAKLQTLGSVLRNVMEDLRGKANGIGVQVPRRLLSEIQQDARQRQRTQIQEVIQNLDREVGVWPAEENYNEVSSLVQQMMDQLPYHVQSQASYSDIRPYAEQALRTKDNSVLSQCVDGLMQLCEYRLSRGSLESSVRCWLSSRSSSATTNLRDLICSALPVPTNEDIKRQLVEHHSQRYHAFRQKVSSVTSPPPKQVKNPCKWVPAALLKEESTNSLSMCYGGVLLIVDLKSGNVFPSSRAHNIRVQRCGIQSGQYQSSGNQFHAPYKKFVPAGESEGGGEGGRSKQPIRVKCSTGTSPKPKASSSPVKVIGNVFQSKNSAPRQRGYKPSPSTCPALASKAISSGTPNSNARDTITQLSKGRNNSKPMSRGAAAPPSGNGKRKGGKKGGSGNQGGGDGGGGDGSGDEGGGKKGKKRKGQEMLKETMLQEQGKQWKNIKKKATGKYQYGDREFYIVKLKETDEDCAVSMDTARHAQSAFKVYKIKGKKLHFSHAIGVDMERIDKHESHQNEVIKLRECKYTPRKGDGRI